MKNTFKNKDILVTGGCGCIGSEIVRQLHKFEPKRIRVFDNNESRHFHLKEDLKDSKIIRNLQGDIRDSKRLRRAMNGVDIVFHAAALKHVPLCEYNPYEAVMTNVIGTQNVIIASKEARVKKVMIISTDKSVNPISTMGATKLLAERLTLSANLGAEKTIFGCVRFGNVFDSDGSVIQTWKNQIKKGEPITITSSEMTRFFMSLNDAVNLILKSVKDMERRDIFILKMPAVRIIDLAEVLIEELAPKYGYKPKDIKIKITGIRPGEKVHETLITEEEYPYVKETEDMFILKSPILSPQEVSLTKKIHKPKMYFSNNRTTTKKKASVLLRKWLNY